MSTIKAAFGGWVPSVNLDKVPTIPCCFVFQLRHKLTPADITDRFTECRILDHVLHRKTFNADRLVFTNQAGRKLVRKITAAISNTSMDTRDLETRFVTILGSLLLFRVSSLSFCQLLFILVEERGIPDSLSRGENDKGLQAQISTNGLLSNRQVRNVCFSQNADEVAVSAILAHGHTGWTDTLWQGTRPVHVQWLAHLGKGHHPIFVDESIGGIGGRLLIPLFVESWVRRATFKKVDERLIQMRLAFTLPR